MNNVGIVYATKTNHSKKIANALGERINQKAVNVSEYKDIKKVELLYIVGGIYAGESNPGLIEFVKKLSVDDIKKVVLITSSLSKAKGQESIRKLLEDKGIKVVDEFMCKGSFLFFGLGNPSKKEIEDTANKAYDLAVKFA